MSEFLTLVFISDFQKSMSLNSFNYKLCGFVDLVCPYSFGIFLHINP